MPYLRNRKRNDVSNCKAAWKGLQSSLHGSPERTTPRECGALMELFTRWSHEGRERLQEDTNHG